MPRKKILKAWRLTRETVQQIEAIADRLKMDKTEVVEACVQLRATDFEDLADEAREALVQIVGRRTNKPTKKLPEVTIPEAKEIIQKMKTDAGVAEARRRKASGTAKE